MEASRFLATTLWICAEQNLTVGDPEREGRRSRARTMSSTMHQVFLLLDSTLNEMTKGSGSKVSLCCQCIQENNQRRAGHGRWLPRE